MGIREFVLDRAKNEGKAEGRTQGRKEGMSQKEYEKNLAFTNSLLRETTFKDEKIARMVGVEVDFVKKIRQDVSKL